MSQDTPSNARGDSTSTARTRPVDLKLKLAEQRLIVQWQDGHRSVFDAATLRRNCPCAACRTERDKRARTALPILSVGANVDLKLAGAELVGQYALKLRWSDGHDTGIYDYRLLRSLDPR